MFVYFRLPNISITYVCTETVKVGTTRVNKSKSQNDKLTYPFIHQFQIYPSRRSVFEAGLVHVVGKYLYELGFLLDFMAELSDLLVGSLKVRLQRGDGVFELVVGSEQLLANSCCQFQVLFFLWKET